MARTGRCCCGHLRYRLAGDLGPLVNCHCRSCRHAHGAAFATLAAVRRPDLQVTAGTDALREYATPEGVRYFCDLRRPAVHANVGSKAPWYQILDDVPQHAALQPR